MDDRQFSILSRYSRGDVPASAAAHEIGPSCSVADVYVLTCEAGLPLPDSDGPFERAQFERAKRMFGAARRESPAGGAA
jgi:hypothetical protein